MMALEIVGFGQVIRLDRPGGNELVNQMLVVGPDGTEVGVPISEEVAATLLNLWTNTKPVFTEKKCEPAPKHKYTAPPEEQTVEEGVPEEEPEQEDPGEAYKPVNPIIRKARVVDKDEMGYPVVRQALPKPAFLRDEDDDGKQI